MTNKNSNSNDKKLISFHINPKIKIRFPLLDKHLTALHILHYGYQSKLSKIVIYK